MTYYLMTGETRRGKKITVLREESKNEERSVKTHGKENLLKTGNLD